MFIYDAGEVWKISKRNWKRLVRDVVNGETVRFQDYDAELVVATDQNISRWSALDWREELERL